MEPMMRIPERHQALTIFLMIITAPAWIPVAIIYGMKEERAKKKAQEKEGFEVFANIVRFCTDHKYDNVILVTGEERVGKSYTDLRLAKFRYCPRPQATVRLQMNQYVRTYTIPHTDNIEIEVHLDPNAGFEESLKVIRDALTGAGVRP